MKRYQKYTDVLDRDKIGFESTIRMKTKQIMLSQLRESAILTWPIFSRNILELIESDELLRPKYERLAFRIFQVHLWHESFSGVRGRGEQ